MSRQQNRAQLRQHIDPKFRRSLRLMLVISLLLFIYVIFDAIRYHATAWQVILSLLIGALVGVLGSRMHKLSWDKQEQHVTNQIDAIGFVVLILFIGFDILRSHIVGLVVHNSTIAPLSLALLAGALYGRVLGGGRRIIHLLREQEILKRK